MMTEIKLLLTGVMILVNLNMDSIAKLLGNHAQVYVGMESLFQMRLVMTGIQKIMMDALNNVLLKMELHVGQNLKKLIKVKLSYFNHSLILIVSQKRMKF